MNESGMETDEQCRMSWEAIIAAWHDWTTDQRKHVCWLAGFDYDQVDRAYIGMNSKFEVIP